MNWWPRKALKSSTAPCKIGIPATRTGKAACTTSLPNEGSARAGTPRFRGRRLRRDPLSRGNIPALSCRATIRLANSTRSRWLITGSRPTPGAKMIHVGKNTRSTIVAKGISAGQGQQTYRGLVKINPTAQGAKNFTQCDSLLVGDQCGAHTVPLH